LLPALVALGGSCGFLAGPAFGLELGELQVQSSLGQPLRASVAYALQPNEQIHDYCIYLKPGFDANGLPSVSNAAITASDGTIRITGRTAIREPLLSLQLTVDCPRSAHLRRDYSVFIDPRLPSHETVAAAATAPAVSRRAVASPQIAAVERAAPSRRPAVRQPVHESAREPIRASGSYRVQPGDSLSGIAARISGRSVGIWPAVDALFAANPDAFIDNDRNLLRADAVLLIPDAILAPQATAAIRSAAGAPVTSGANAPAQLPVAAADSGRVAIPQSADAGVSSASVTAIGGAAIESSAVPAQAEHGAEQPAQGLAGPDGPFKAPLEANAAVSDAASFAAPVETVPPASVEESAAAPVDRSSARAGSDSRSWLIWLGGSGIALIVALLLFGRRLKARFLPAPGSANAVARRRTDADNDDTDVALALGLPSQETATVARMVSLDADLEDGSGFHYGGDVDVAQDFGFSEDSGQFGNSSGNALHSAAAGAARGRIPDVPLRGRMGEATILVSETPPQHDDSGEYKVSMIVDATKQVGEDADTTKDLRAIEVDADEDTVSEEYTVNKDIDYSILEQDYEDEFSATQALNAEIARAACALSKQFGKNEMGDTLADTTNEKMNDSVSDAFSEAFIAASDDETSLLPYSGDSSADDETTALPAAAAERLRDTSHLAISSTMSLDDTANEEIALEVPAADNDSTVEVQAETVTITRKMRAS
jgi:hypothetical protein